MINTNILNILESNFQDPGYSVIISKFEQPEFCNKDQLKIYMQQFTPNLETIIETNQNNIDRLKKILKNNNIPIPDDLYVSEINSCIQKTFIIDSALNYNKKDSMYISQLNGTLENDIDKDLTHRMVRGKIENSRVVITENDVPNYLNRSKFKIKDNNLIITFPKKIKTADIQIIKTNTHADDCEDNENNIDEVTEHITYTANNSNSNIINIPLNLCRWKYQFSLSYQLKENFVFQKIESITTPLKHTIDINFSHVYNNVPGIILTIDEDKKVYSSYLTKFIKNEDNCYTGVSIQFKGLKRQKEYGDINITIIGAQKQEDD